MAVVDGLKVQPQNLPGDTEENNNKDPQETH
jgi:hypothetical protein